MINASGWPCAGWVVRGTIAWRWLKPAFLREWPGVLGQSVFTSWTSVPLSPSCASFMWFGLSLSLVKAVHMCKEKETLAFYEGGLCPCISADTAERFFNPVATGCWVTGSDDPVRATGSAGRPLCQAPAWELSTSVRSPKPWVLFIPSLVENVSKKTDLQKILELM